MSIVAKLGAAAWMVAVGVVLTIIMTASMGELNG